MHFADGQRGPGSATAQEPPARPRARQRSLVVLALGALLLALLLGACSAGADQATSADGEALAEDAGVADGGSDEAAVEADAGAADAGAAQDRDGAQSATEVVQAQAGAAPGRMIARDAGISLVIDDVTKAAAQVRAAAAATDGYVVSEEVTPAEPEGADGAGYATFVLSVPSESLDQAVDRVGTLGTVVRSDLTSTDVTEQYVDTTARIETLQASVDRVRALLGEAGTIKDIVALERELSDREAELDALRAVQQSLGADVSRSSLTVELQTDQTETIVAQEQGNGFMAGLRRGWSAFGETTAALLTGVGAVLPFAIALAVLVVPVLWWYRRRSRAGAVGPEADQLRA